MNKVQTYAAALFIGFLAMAFGIDWFNSEAAHLESYSEKIESYLRNTEAKAEKVFDQKELWWKKVFSPEYLPELTKTALLEDLRHLSNQPFGLYFYKNDSLVFWSRNNYIPAQNEFDSQGHGYESFVQLGNGYYEVLRSDFEGRENDSIRAVILIPVKNDFKLESTHLKNSFAADRDIPGEVKVSLIPTAYPVRAADGKALFYLDAEGPFKDAHQQQWLLICYLLATICLVVLINSIARYTVQKYRPWWGAAFLITTIIGLRLISFHFDLTQKFDNLAIFTRTFETPVLNYSLGDLLIDVLLLLWLMVFFHREFKVKQFVNISKPWQLSLTTLNYFSIILGILMVISVFKSLVMDSGITFDFDNVFKMDIYSIMAILSVIILLFAMFLFSHRMMLTIQMTGLNKKSRLTSLITALLIAIPLLWVTEIHIAVYQVVMLAGLYILLFDMYIDNKHPSITWLGIWVVFFASFSSALLFKYNEDKDLETRLEYARKLSEWRDTVAEADFYHFIAELEKDAVLQELVYAEYSDTNLTPEIAKRIDQVYSNYSYLFNIYSYKFVVSGGDDSAIFPSPEDAQDSLINSYIEKIYKAKATDYEGIFLWPNTKDWFSYLARPVITHATAPGDEKRHIYFEIKMRLREPSMVYTELILTKYYKRLENLDRYDYAIYRNGNLIEQNSNIYENTLYEFPLPPQGMYEEKIFGERSELIYNSEDETIVIIGRAIRNLLKPVSLFSYVFVLLIITVIIIASLNTFTRVLPEALQLTIWRKPSLRTRIQLSVVAVIILSFIMIGWVTVIYFRNISNEYHENRLFRKLASVLMDSEHQIQARQRSAGFNVDLQQVIGEIAPHHRMDINVYDLKGNVVTSTEMDIFNKSVIASKMGAVAFHALSRQGFPEVIQEEKIGNLDYKSAYVPLRLPDGKINGYIGLPYYAKQRNLRDDVTEFMGTLLNVYVFLLMIASIIAIFVANSISKPIGVIGERFRRFKLGSNEPLVWDSKDELGDLIEDYNRMMEKLEDSTVKLKKSEREGAWRVMAQQVAHEIQNPLTPMKLSIQYLQHAIKKDPENVQPLFDRVAKTLTEQIEALSQIAISFSNFAKMPKPQNQRVNMNELMESAYLLFSENDTIDISLKLPEEQLSVFADKNQLMRVFNNIISNGIQAVPDERKPKIAISLFEDKGKVLVKVSDNGKGIPDEMHEKVFAPHFTTRSSGMGLGLAMCKDIVEFAGGQIYFDTIEDKGTDFYVELPLMAKELPDKGEEE